MNFTNFMNLVTKHLPVLSLILSAIVAWLIVPLTDGFPFVPFFLFFSILGSLVFLIRKDRSWFDVMLYLGILILSCFLLIRANEVILLIDLFFIIIFGSLLILPIARDHALMTLLLTPLSVIVNTLNGRNIFPYSWKKLDSIKRGDKMKQYLPTILVTLLFLGISTPLLASANPFFNTLIQNVLNFFNLTSFMRYFTAEELVLNVIRVFAFAVLAYGIPRVISLSSEGGRRRTVNLSLPVNYLIPKIAMGILLVLFFITQAQLYFATPDSLQSMGYTNSRLTNEVFFQVTLVAFIIFILTYLDTRRNSWNKKLTYILLLEAFFLIGIAFKSVIDYSFLWGLTQKRLWGYATMSWLTGAMVLFLYYYSKKIPILPFFRLIITLTVLVLVGINILNFDYLIAHYSQARTPSGTDYVYLARLSPDTHYYKETLTNLIDHVEKSSTLEHEKVNAAFKILRKIDSLKRKYSSNVPINSLNLAEYQEYLRVSDINTDSYRKKLFDREQKFDPPESSHQSPSDTEGR
jgi:hypothetical protein